MAMEMKFVNNTHYYINNDNLILKQTQRFRNIVDVFTKSQSLIFRYVNLSGLSQLISIFGIVSNAINLTVFYKQGLNSTTNISFFALAISDMICLVATSWHGICWNPSLETANIPFIAKEIQHLTGGWLHVCFGRTTSWLTAFITAERCLGIALPLKVKQIVTVRRTTFSVCFIYSVNLAMLLPEYCIAYWDWKFDPARNRSLLGLVYRSNKEQAYGLVHIMTSVSGMLSFVAVICLTTFLVSKLAQKSKWRSTATGGSDNSDIVSTRDKKTIKMIVMIASVLIVCYTPGIALTLVTDFVPEFMLSAELENTFISCWSLAFMFDAINSSVNMLLYYKMSTKYRHTFQELSCFKGEKQQNFRQSLTDKRIGENIYIQ